MRLPFVVALGILVVGFGMAWVGAPPFPEDACLGDGQPEGSSVSYELSFRPPGATECVYESPGGDVTRSTAVPWREWAAIGVFALACGFAASGVARPAQPSLRRVGIAGVLAIAAGSINFGLI